MTPIRLGLYCLFLLIPAVGMAQKVGIKTNVLYDATGSISLGLETALAPRWTLDLSTSYNAWEVVKDRKWRHLAIQPEARYWFCDRFNGHFIGIHAQWAMEFVRQFLRRNFGEQAVEEGQQILLNLFERAKQEDEDFPGSYRNTILDCCAQIRGVLSYEQRLQLLSFLTQISQSDGQVCQEEIKALKEIAQHLGLSEAEVNSMLNLRSDHLEDAYKVLEITPSATDAEVRTAYKKMALKHHPDRVATLGEDIRRNAEEKFQQINDAKERIYKARGLK